MKKEISDHIARTFFERKEPEKKQDFPFLYITVTALVIVVLIFGLNFFLRKKINKFLLPGEYIVLEKQDGPYVLSFNFLDSSLRLQSLVIDIPSINLSGYKKIKFLIRFKNAGSAQLGNLKVGLVNRRKETSSLYISNITSNWKEFVLPLSDFDKIHDWSNLAKLSFIAEDWNLFQKKGDFLIDGIEFLKN